MGNFIGDQVGWERNSGVVLKISFTKNFQNNRTVLNKVNYIPTFVNKYYANGKMVFQTIPVDESILKLEQGEAPESLSEEILPVLKQIASYTRQQLGPDIHLRDN